MSTAIVFPNNFVREIKTILPFIPFKSKDEFVVRAAEDKLLEYKKILFFEGTEKIRKSLAKRGISPEVLVKEFDEQRHQK